MYPLPAATRLDDKLDFLKERELLFFTPGKSFLPLLLGTRTVWNNSFPSSNSPCILDGNTQLTYITKRSGTAEIEIRRNDATANVSLKLEINRNGTSRTFALSEATVVIAVPVETGFNDFTFRVVTPPEASGLPPEILIGAPVLRESASAGSLKF